jgi:hypothetical protein
MDAYVGAPMILWGGVSVIAVALLILYLALRSMKERT